MEILAGDDDTLCEQHELDCVYKFDFKDVYWNSRLENEHRRIVNKCKQGEAVCDVMAGVGPFAMPLGKKKVITWANDLNPESYKSLLGNIKLNKVSLNNYIPLIQLLISPKGPTLRLRQQR